MLGFRPANRISRAVVLVALAVMLCGSMAGAATPIWVHQPAYDGMSFYVYQPANINKGWYVTYDGYSVFKNWNGVWVYGSRVGDTIVPTEYVVGSVVPEVVGIAPWVQQARVSSGTAGNAVQPVPYTPQMVAPVAPVAPTAQVAAVPQPILVAPRGNVNYMPPAPNGEVAQVPAVTPLLSAATVPVAQTPVQFAYVPGWTSDPTFMAVANWHIDRVGVLNQPALPVAWKGHNPEVIYAWTGKTWQQIEARNKTAISAIRSAVYALVRRANYEHLNWSGADSAVLASCAATWGCRWLGEIIVNENY